MSPRSSQLHLAVASAIALALAACGGGGGGGSSSVSESDSFSLPGTAATGAPYPDDSSVTVTDAAGASFTGKVAGGAGNYTVDVKKSAKAPFVVQVSAPNLPTLVSVSAEAQPARVNVTPITHLIAATLSPSGNPEKLAEEIKASTATVNSQTLAAKKNEVRENILKDVSTALGDDTDPISGKIDIGTGHDLVLEALKIQVQPVEGGKSNVSVALKSDRPVDLAFALGSGGATLPKLSEQQGYTAPQRSDLAGEGLPTQIAALLSRMTACYALPQSERIRAGGTGAADISAAACKSIFLDQDPGKYKFNGYTVSSTGAFKGIFSNSPVAQSIRFGMPSFEYKVKNGNTTDTTQPMDGDVVFTAGWQDSKGNSGIDEYWARPNAQGQLFLTGNLSNLDITVSPRAELREFITRTGKDFYNTGYNLFVHAKHPYAKVVVTSPKGGKITLVKAAGLGYFVIAKDGTPTGTSVLRLAGAYVDTATSGSPRSEFADLVWAGTADTPDSEIAAFPLQGTWTFELYTKAADSTPAATTKRRTLQRAPSLAEARKAAWPTLTAAARQQIKSESDALGFIKLGGGEPITVATGDKDDQPAWEVPAGAWSPLRLTAFGRDPSGAQGFDDAANLRSSARTGTIFCSKTETTDTHCDAQARDRYAQNTQLHALHFSGRDSRRVQMNYAVQFSKPAAP